MQTDGLRQKRERSRALRVCHLVVRSGFKVPGSSRPGRTMYNQKMFIFWFRRPLVRRWPTAESAAGAERLPVIPVCGSDHRCVDSAHPTHTSRTVQGEIPGCSPFPTRATKDDGKSAITTSRFQGREGRARPVCRWAHELRLTHPIDDRLKPSRLAAGRWVEAMAAPECVESRRRGFSFFRRPMTGRVGSSPTG